MKALILAAGLGSRLAPITDNCPKSLVPVNGQPILMKQIENLHVNGIRDITIISGHRADILGIAVCRSFPEIRIIHSENYATTNNMYSAYLAKEAMAGEGFLMMNADVFFDASVIAELLRFHHPDAIVTDIGTYLEESMKVIEDNGRLVKISKIISREDALGSSIDVYKFSREGAEAFFGKCAEYIGNKRELKLWSEVALNDILPVIEFKACPLVGRWFEIDNHDDLAAAEKLFSN
ncbi:MAG: NTP transferase domain-containing protein [Christensenellales bacterium]